MTTKPIGQTQHQPQQNTPLQPSTCNCWATALRVGVVASCIFLILAIAALAPAPVNLLLSVIVGTVGGILLFKAQAIVDLVASCFTTSTQENRQEDEKEVPLKKSKKATGSEVTESSSAQVTITVQLEKTKEKERQPAQGNKNFNSLPKMSQPRSAPVTPQKPNNQPANIPLWKLGEQQQPSLFNTDSSQVKTSNGFQTGPQHPFNTTQNNPSFKTGTGFQTGTPHPFHTQQPTSSSNNATGFKTTPSHPITTTPPPSKPSSQNAPPSSPFLKTANPSHPPLHQNVPVGNRNTPPTATPLSSTTPPNQSPEDLTNRVLVGTRRKKN